MKPLNAKAYGSIAHLPISKMGQGDKRVHLGQAVICLEKLRDQKDIVHVQEKLDGSCVAVANIEENIVALTRAGYTCDSSPYEQHRMFGEFVKSNEDRFRSILKPGERLVGEWLALAHGTKYRLTHEPFVVFDLMAGTTRATVEELQNRNKGQFVLPSLLHSGGPLPLHHMAQLLDNSSHGAELMEGAVYRVERGGKVDFLAKFVRPDFPCGKYLKGITGHEDVWNWKPSE